MHHVKRDFLWVMNSSTSNPTQATKNPIMLVNFSFPYRLWPTTDRIMSTTAVTKKQMF